MLRGLPLIVQGLSAFADVFDHGLFLVDLLTQLVEVDHLQPRAVSDRAGGGLQLAKQQFQQRGLAGSVGSDDSDAVSS